LHARSDVDLTFPTAAGAAMVAEAVGVDEELQPDKIHRAVMATGNKLTGHFKATEARLLRVSLSSFYDMVSVCLRTLQEFDDSGGAAA